MKSVQRSVVAYKGDILRRSLSPRVDFKVFSTFCCICILRRPMHLSMHTKSFCYHYSFQYSFKFTGYFPHYYRRIKGDRGMNPVATTIVNPRTDTCRSGDRTNDLLFSYPARY